MHQNPIAAAIDAIGGLVLRDLPDGWKDVVIECRTVGTTSEGTVRAVGPDGARLDLRGSWDLWDAFDDLRAELFQPGKGTWFSATYHLVPPGEATLSLDYDDEPAWRTPTDVGHYLEDWEKYPRAPEFTPAWLAERLDEARARDKSS